MQKANVSVIVPCYNSQKTIQRAIESVLNQTLLPSEIIVVDDCSTDNSLEVVYSLINAYNTDIIQVIALNRNQGPGVARNVGWDAATAKYIAFLDSDDSWAPQKLELQFNWMEKNQEYTLVGHKLSFNLQQGIVPTTSNICTTIQTVTVTKKSLLFSNPFVTSSVMVKNLPYRFPKNKKYSEDFHLWLKIVLNGHNAIVFNNKLAYSYKKPFSKGGLSGDLVQMEKSELQNFKEFKTKKLLSSKYYYLAASFSIIKFFIRLLKSWIRNLKNHNS